MQVGADELEEFCPCGLALEGSDKITGGGHGALFLHASHRHAEVPCLDNDGYAQRVQGIVDGVLDLRRQAFLHLKAARLGLHHTGYLAQPCDVAVGDIAHMRLADKRNKVVFA